MHDSDTSPCPAALRRLALLLLLLSVSASLAQTTPDTATGTHADVPRVASTNRNQTIDDYRTQLDNLNGAYSQPSLQIHLALAERYAEQGMLEEAGSSLQEALQAERINGGLYSEAQLAILELTLGNAIDRNDWEQVDKSYQLRAHLASKIYPDSDPRSTRLRSESADWMLLAYQLELLPSININAMQQVVETYDDIGDALLQGAAAGSSRQLARSHVIRGIAYYHSAIYADSLPLSNFVSHAPDTQTIRECVEIERAVGTRIVRELQCTYTDVPNPERFTDRERQKRESIDQSIRAMHRHFQLAINIVEADPDSSVADLALAHLTLGDALFRTANFQQANQKYRLVGELLAANPEEDRDVRILLDKPGRLFPDSYSGQTQLLNKVLPLPSGRIKFDISREGEISNMVISGGREDRSPENVERVSKHFTYVAYRPAIVDGRAVDSSFEGPANELQSW